MRRIALLGIMLLCAHPLAAQAERETGFMVHQWLICPAQHMDEVNQLTDRLVPILDQLRQEGMIRAWYDVRHAWGDEWNYGFISVVDSHRAWLDFWSEYLRRVDEAEADVFPRVLELCELHKDNLYSIRNSRGGGP